MRRYVHVILVLLALGAHALAATTSGIQRAKPETASTVEKALQRATLLSRPAVIYFQMQGCSWCRRFESEVLTQDAVKQKLADFELIKADIFDEKALAQQYGVRGAPAFVLIDASGAPAAKWTGYLDRDKLFKFLAGAKPSALAAEGSSATGESGMDVMTTPTVIAELRKKTFGDINDEQLTQFVLLSADANTKFLSDEILQKQELPVRALIPLLRHKMLAVRLATLQLLEDRSGDSFGFDAWADTPVANQEPLAKWEAWAAGSQEQRPPSTDSETLAGYINELLSDDIVRSQRGFRALLRVGEPSVAELSRFESANPAFAPDQKGRIRELRYAITLSAMGVQDAEPLAHRLVFGNLDVRIQAMNTISQLGPKTLPILDAFLASNEPLEREAAVECVLRAGRAAAIPRIASILEKDSDPNVVHAALRKLGETQDAASPQVLQPFIGNENEDLSIAALEGLAKLEAKTSAPAIIAAMKDERWRVRVAALKAASDLELAQADAEVKQLLSDPDEFVRISAVQAAAKLNLQNAQDLMQKLFNEQDALKPAIVQSYSRMNGRIPDSFITSLDKAPVDVVLATIGSIPDADNNLLPLLQWAASHKNDDIACAALRLVAAEGLDNPDNLKLIETALLSNNARRVQTVLQSAVIDRSKVAETLSTADTVSFSGTAETDGSTRYRGSSGEPKLDLAALTSAVRKAKVTDEADRINAAILLAQFGDQAAAAEIASKLPSLSATQRARYASALSVQRTAKMAPVFERLLNDPEREVRNEAISSLFEDGSTASCAALLFDVLQKPGSNLRPTEALHYRLTSRHSIRQPAIPAYRAVYQKALQSTSDPKLQILALYLLGHTWNADCTEIVKPFLSSDNPWLRRAAYFTLCCNNPAELKNLRDQILSETSPYVRAVYPAAYIRENFYWKTYFSESEHDTNSEDGSDGPQPTLDPEAEKAIRKLQDDPDPGVQMMAGMALFTNNLPLDAGKFFAVVKQSPDARYLSYTFRNVFQKNIDRMPDEYAQLVQLISDREDDEDFNAKLSKRFPSAAEVPIESSQPAATQLVGVISSAATPAPVRQASLPAPSSPDVQLVYFSKPGCSHCARVKAMLARVSESYPELKVVEFNINKNQSMELNESLSRRFAVPENLRLVAPSVFTSAGFLVNDEIVEERVGDLIQQAKAPGNTPLEIEKSTTAESPASSQAIVERYGKINPGIIISAGVLDGLNPCAFATIIFLLSYLQIARKTPREMAQIGIAYVAGVFSAYFLLGLGLSELVAQIVVFRMAAMALNIGMGVFALVIAVLSFRDGIRCLQGRLQDISLQLPAFLKDRIRTVIRKSVPHRGFVLAAFGVGAFISLLELACTGQVYAPTILYMIQAGKGGAAGYLLLYNFAFILPLTVIFIMAFFGLTSGKLTTFLQRHAAIVKFGMALLFFVLAFVLFAREWQG
jgi:HEAT repeat protein/cytochrome c biogenesis protein CcdA/thioredoxin-related protein